MGRVRLFLQAFLGVLAALIVAACLALGTLAVVGLGRHTDTVAQQQLVACRSVNQLRSVLVSIVARSAKSIPTIKYYKEHPAELARAESQTKAEEQRLQPVSC